MSREKELVQNTAILSIGKLLPKLMAFITLPILTAQLTKAEYGTYDLISTLVMLAIPIATLQIQSAAFRFLIDCRGNKRESSLIITNILVVTFPVAIMASIIVQFFFASYSLIDRILISSYFLVDTIFLTFGQIVRGLGNNKEYSIAAVLLSIINMIAVVCTVQIVNTGLLGVLFSLTIANLIASIYLAAISNIFNYVSLKLVLLEKIKNLFAYSWPMIPNNLSNWILKLSDRLVITAFLGVEANAVYAVANKIPNLLSIAQSVLVMAWHENASIAVGDIDATGYYSKMLKQIFNLMFGCTALLIAGTPLIFQLLIKGNYDDAYYQMPVLIIAMFFFVMSSYFGGIYVAHKRTVNVGISTMIAAGINLFVDITFVRQIGIWAGSISTLIAYLFLYVYRMMNCQKFQKVYVDIKGQLIKVGILIVLLVMCYMRTKVLNMVNFILGSVIFVICYKEIILKILTRFKKIRI